MGNAYVAGSTIHGKGVFAASAFEDGGEILQIDDSYEVSGDRANGRVEEQEVDYCDYLANGKVVLMQPPERHINHSCDPNTYIKTINGVRRVLARRGISKGEEINCDYSINNTDTTIRECNCGTPRCRRSSTYDFFGLPMEIQCEYLPLLDAWFVEENKNLVEELTAECKGLGAAD